MKKWIEELKDEAIAFQRDDPQSEDGIFPPTDILNLIAEIETLEAIVEKDRVAFEAIKQMLGYGIMGCPTDGEYHKETYQQAYDVAKQALVAHDKEKDG